MWKSNFDIPVNTIPFINAAPPDKGLGSCAAAYPIQI